jgi:hypothetical protein
LKVADVCLVSCSRTFDAQIKWSPDSPTEMSNHNPKHHLSAGCPPTEVDVVGALLLWLLELLVLMLMLLELVLVLLSAGSDFVVDDRLVALSHNVNSEFLYQHK